MLALSFEVAVHDVDKLIRGFRSRRPRLGLRGRQVFTNMIFENLG